MLDLAFERRLRITAAPPSGVWQTRVYHVASWSQPGQAYVVTVWAGEDGTRVQCPCPAFGPCSHAAYSLFHADAYPFDLEKADVEEVA